MTLSDWKLDPHGISADESSPVQGDPPSRRLHKIRDIRRQQQVSLRSAARRMQMEVSELKSLEKESSDMSLSMLYKWQRALDVPIADLLVEDDDPLSSPILTRARMVRLMKTATMIHETVNTVQLRRMSQMLVEQLLEMMPELKDVNAWPSVGQRRSLDECGRIGEQPLPDDLFF